MDKIISFLENKLNYLYFDFMNSEVYYNRNYNRFTLAERERQEKMKDSLYKELQYIKALIHDMGLYYKWDYPSNWYIVSTEKE